jgi:hypothetical protein
MPTDRLSEHDFDKMLGRALRSSSQPVPADFTEKMLKRVRQCEEQRVLARIVLQERLALAGCIALVAAALVAGLVFPDASAEFLHRAAGALTQQGRAFVEEIPQTIEVIRGQWQWYLALAAGVVLAVYSAAGLWLGERLRTI